MSLRSRLLIGLVLLTTGGLAAMAVATYEEQRSFLYQRLDQQVAASPFLVAGQLGVRLGPAGAGATPSGRVGPLPRARRATVAGADTYGELLGRGERVLKVAAFTYGERRESPPRLPRHLVLSRLGPSAPHVFTAGARNGSGPGYRVAAFSLSDGRVLVVAVSLRDVDATLHRLLVVEGSVGGGVIILLLSLGWVVIQVGLRPLGRIGRLASEIAGGDLGRRLPSANPNTEVGRLALALNEMLGQIEQAFADRTQSEERLREFLADASHELRTPLASVRAYAEAFRLGAVGDPLTLERTMGRIENEAARMGVLVEDLLLLARLDRMPSERRKTIDLTVLARHAVQDARAVAPGRSVTLESDGPCLVVADPDQLRQVLANLVRNAVIHTPAEAPVSVRVWSEEGVAWLEVRDHGPGLPVGAEGKVFERFWRTEQGRRRGPGGAGLGLAIVKAIVETHGGEVSAWNSEEGGAVFGVRLPATGRS